MSVPREEAPLSVAAMLAMTAAVAAMVFSFRFATSFAGIDFYQFWAGAQIARSADGPSLYSPEARRVVVRDENSQRLVAAASARKEAEFYSTPFLYSCFGALPRRYETAFLIYCGLTVAAAALALILLTIRNGLSVAQAFLLVALVLTFWEPQKSDLRVGNVNSLQLLVIAIGVQRALPAAARGALFGLLAMFKPNTLLVLPVLLLYRLVKRDFKRLAAEAAGGCAGALVAFSAGSIYFGTPHAWSEWLAAARDLARNAPALAAGNIAPARGPAAAVAGIVLCAAAALMLHRLRRDANDAAPLVVGFALAAYVAVASLVWIHYFVLLLPLIAALTGQPGAIGRRVTAAAGFLCMAGAAWHPATPYAEVRLYWSGLALLAAAFFWRLTEREMPVPSEHFRGGRALSG